MYSYYGRITISNSTFAGNSADFAGGGFANFAGTASVNNSRFEGNEAAYGGALFNRSEYEDALIEGSGSVYVNNRATVSGGAFLVESGRFDQQNVTISDNISYSGASVLYTAINPDGLVVSPVDITVNQSSITGNTMPLIVSTSAGSVDFSRNYWGQAGGPDPDTIVGDEVDVSDPLDPPSGQCGISETDDDGDCLTNEFELGIPGLLIDQQDSDGDGIDDGDEDYDDDGLSNYEEQQLGTDPTSADSDGDDLPRRLRSRYDRHFPCR